MFPMSVPILSVAIRTVSSRDLSPSGTVGVAIPLAPPPPYALALRVDVDEADENDRVDRGGDEYDCARLDSGLVIDRNSAAGEWRGGVGVWPGAGPARMSMCIGGSVGTVVWPSPPPTGWSSASDTTVPIIGDAGDACEAARHWSSAACTAAMNFCDAIVAPSSTVGTAVDMTPLSGGGTTTGVVMADEWPAHPPAIGVGVAVVDSSVA